MPHKKRKVRKRRGSRTHGYGRVGQHRGGGQRGGHGKAGYDKHKWTYTIKYDPEHFGKHGFTRPRKKEIQVLNVGELDEQIDRLIENKHAEKTKEGIVVHLNRLGYSELLGDGQVRRPLIVHVASSSKSATKKIVAARGKIVQNAVEK